MEKSIIICGFICCGKSTVGKLLAQIMKRRFLDIGREIVRRDGRPEAVTRLIPEWLEQPCARMT